ncbi:MAG TPA: 3-hydroxyacyl-CoA dehydrogenase NAD-binding domain-containing protein [Stellaceae bacterium]|jgi:3-hydroxyacyl-CoA dehydrogenase|nr:3-hydroxyacyl-CoA dehydrogenase NAD-binding domain-containing protein [Stellaceae bacterium]
MGSLNASVDLRRDGNVAVVTIDNPPVNALKQEVRAGLAEALRQARDDASVAAVVIACAGRTFFAGADITEFGKPPQAPALGEVIAQIESMPKPVVAALHGTALGGGFEVALACHFRVAARSARMGLPEVKLGLLPGAGGTQRVPRLVGPEKALRMIVSGDPVGAAAALAEGIVDEIIEGDLTAGALLFARRSIAERRPLQKVRDREDKLAAARTDPTSFDDLATALTARLRGQEAPAACVEAVRNAFALPFDDGLQRESELFRKLVAGDQSKAQRHVFFAEREAAKVPNLPEGTQPRPIARAAVLGAGTMGGGIAMCCANAGIPVTLIETSLDLLQKGRDRIAANYRATVARGGLSAEEMERRVGLIAGAIGISAAADADVVIEAVFEELDLKKRVFGELDRVAKPGALLATNTSTLDVNEIARATGRPQDVVGTHFFSPANVMRLLEIVRGADSAPDAIATALALARRLGKVPAVVGVCYGFVGNRMLARRSVEAERLLLEGALPQEVEATLVEFGLPMGPFAMMDLAGLDVGWLIRKSRGESAVVEDALCAAGRFGQKTGQGYFRYEAGRRVPIPDDEVEQIILDASARLGIQRRRIEPEEIVERMVLPMVNEGARILEEGIATQPGDIDVIWVYGYGWPAWRGGPMYYADQQGLGQVRDRLAFYAERSRDESLRPAKLLARLANEGRGFAV